MVELSSRSELARAFEEALTQTLPAGWRMGLDSEKKVGDARVDAFLELASPRGETIRACVEFKARAEPADVMRLVPWLQECGSAILVAPAIRPRARDILSKAGISWIEPDGDCRIALGSLFIERLGRGIGRRPVGTPGTRYVADLFSGGALRVVRWLLIDPDRPWKLTDMSERTGLTVAFVSRTFKTLARDAYLDRVRGASRLRDGDALLDAWAAAPGPRDAVFERVDTSRGPEALLRAFQSLTPPESYAITAEAAADIWRRSRDLPGSRCTYGTLRDGTALFPWSQFPAAETLSLSRLLMAASSMVPSSVTG